jgi:hypothetical protein
MLNSEDIHKRFLDALTEAGKKKPNSKPIKQDLTPSQIERFNQRYDILFPQFKRAIGRRHFNDAKNAITDLQTVLRERLIKQQNLWN